MCMTAAFQISIRENSQFHLNFTNICLPGRYSENKINVAQSWIWFIDANNMYGEDILSITQSKHEKKDKEIRMKTNDFQRSSIQDV